MKEAAARVRLLVSTVHYETRRACVRAARTRISRLFATDTN